MLQAREERVQAQAAFLRREQQEAAGAQARAARRVPAGGLYNAVEHARMHAQNPIVVSMQGYIACLATRAVMARNEIGLSAKLP